MRLHALRMRLYPLRMRLHALRMRLHALRMRLQPRSGRCVCVCMCCVPCRRVAADLDACTLLCGLATYAAPSMLRGDTYTCVRAFGCPQRADY